MKSTYAGKKILSISCLVVAMLAIACGKDEKKEESQQTESTSAPASSGGVSSIVGDEEQAKNVADIYSKMSGKIGQLQIMQGDNGLALTEESLTSDQWDNERRFNCYGECNDSAPARQFVADALNQKKSGPIGEVVKNLELFCKLGVVLSASGLDGDGLPVVVTDLPLTVNETAVSDLKNLCGATEEELVDITTFDITVTVADAGGQVFDRLITFKIAAGNDNESFSYYVKNSGGVVSVAMGKEQSEDGSSYGRSMFKYSLTTKNFQFESFGRTPATGETIQTGGSLSFTRGYQDGTTKEIAILSVTGNDYYQINSAFLALSSNERESEAGVYLSRAAEGPTALAGAFVCFNMLDGSYINSSGCTENPAKSRKIPWSPESTLYQSIRSATAAQWGLGALTEVADFDETTISVLNPQFN